MKKKHILALALLFVSVLLSACSTNTELWIFTGGAWKMERTLEYNYDVLPSVSIDFLRVDAGEVLRSSTEMIIPQVISYWQQNGINVEFEKSERADLIVYTFNLSGDDINSLHFALGDDLDMSQYSDELGPYGDLLSEMMVDVDLIEHGSDRYSLMMDYSGMGGLNSMGVNFTLHGTNIQSNAFETTNTSATWHGPLTIEAEFGPARRVSTQSILIVVGVILLIGIVVIAAMFIFKPRRAVSRSGYGRDRRTSSRSSRSSLSSRSYRDTRNRRSGSSRRRR